VTRRIDVIFIVFSFAWIIDTVIYNAKSRQWFLEKGHRITDTSQTSDAHIVTLGSTFPSITSSIRIIIRWGVYVMGK